MSQYEQILAIRKMNRKDKRALAKKLKISYNQLLEMINFEIADVTVEQLPEGTRVKLKVDKILERKEELSDRYINWVELHRNDVFTCERDPEFPDDSKRVVFKEDENEVKWSFHVSDLELVLD
jgi:hypothetical protein